MFNNCFGISFFVCMFCGLRYDESVYGKKGDAALFYLYIFKKIKKKEEEEDYVKSKTKNEIVIKEATYIIVVNDETVWINYELIKTKTMI